MGDRARGLCQRASSGARPQPVGVSTGTRVSCQLSVVPVGVAAVAVMTSSGASRVDEPVCVRAV